jgi:hypothetical protein
MKPKKQLRVQPREIVPPRSADGHIIHDEVEEEIQNFLRAVNSYPARVAKEPGVSFHQHLRSISARNDKQEDQQEEDEQENDRRDSRLRHH